MRLSTGFIFILFTLSFKIFAQTPRIDSLELLLKNMKEDTVKVNLLTDLSYLLLYYDQEKAYKSGQDALDLSKKIEFIPGEITALHTLSNIHQAKGELDQSTELIETALALYEYTNDNRIKHRFYLSRATNEHMNGQMELALDDYFKGIEYAGLAKDTIELINGYYSVGAIYGESGDFEKAKKYMKISLDFSEESNDQWRSSTGYAALAEIESDTTLKYNYIQKSIEYAEPLNDPYSIAFTNYVMGNFLLDIRQDATAAIPYYRKSLLTAQSMNNAYFLTYVPALYGKAFLQIGQLDSAAYYTQMSLKSGESSGDLATHNNAAKQMADILGQQGKFKTAYGQLSLAYTLNDSLFSETNAKELAEADTRYETSKKEAQLAEQQLTIAQQKNRQSRIIIIGLVILTLTVGIFQYFFYQQKRKKKEVELVLAIEQTEAERLKKLDEMKTQFFTNVSHELRTPLTLIISPLEEVLKKLKQVNLEPDLKLAQRNSKNLLKLVDEVLDLSKMEVGKLAINTTRIALIPWLKRVFFSFQSAAELKGVSLDFNSDLSEETMVKTDFPKLEKVVNNLISNALKFSPKGGQIKVNAHVVTEGGSSNLKLSISDNGPGIQADDLPHIFDRFFQSKHKHTISGGTGIGLALSKQLVLLLKGELSVQSEWGKGSHFTLIIPCELITSEASLVSSKPSPSSLPKSQEEIPLKYQPSFTNSNKPRLLIVEDNLEMGNYLMKSLSKSYECSLATDGEEAIKLLSSGNAKNASMKTFDLITSDVMMPNVDGFAFRKKLNERPEWSKIPFILLTARTLESDKLKGFQLGIDDYITKPFSLPELEARIFNLLRNKRLREEITEEELTNSKNKPNLRPEQQLLQEAEKLVLKRMDDPEFSVEVMAKQLGHSQRQLARIFGKTAGLTPVQFVLELRLQRARQLLETKHFATVNEVRYEVGIESASYFTRKFTERFGKNPSEYNE